MEIGNLESKETIKSVELIDSIRKLISNGLFSKASKIYFRFSIHNMRVLLVYPVLNATLTNILPFRKITQMEHPLSNVTKLHSTAVSRMPMYANSR